MGEASKKGRISAVGLGFTFAGCFLGAGYVSGRELWQFFGKYGIPGFAGLVFSLLLLFYLGTVTLLLTRRTADIRLGEVVIPWKVPRLKSFADVFTVFFLYGISCIMTAGAGALFGQAFGLPPQASALAFALLVAILTLTGLEGMIAVFSLIVPILVLSTLLLSVTAFFRFPAEAGFFPADSHISPGSLVFSAVVYAAYNMFGSVAILAPLGERTRNRKTLYGGILFGTLLLFLIAASILLVLITHPETTKEELPMLSVAGLLSQKAEWIFALLLLAAMLGTAFSCFLTAFRQTKEMVPLIQTKERFFVLLFSILLWLGSLFGFSRLIDWIYPVFGVIGAFFLAGLVLNYRKRMK